MLLSAFKDIKRPLRGNLHSHTTVSDGAQSPAEVVQAYREKDYDFLALTDHGKVVEDAPSLGDKDFLVIRGAELHPENHYGGNMYHFVAVDLAGDYDTAGKHPQQVIDEVTAGGTLLYLAHPSWSGHGRADLFPLHGYHGVEVANHTCRRIGRSFSEDQWDDINTRQGITWGIGVDDGHHMNDIGGAWVMVNACNSTLDAIKQALRAGCFYSSTGPEIHSIEVEAVVTEDEEPVHGTKVTVRSSPANRVYLRSIPTHGTFLEGSDITEAELTTGRRNIFYRVVVEDAKGKRAWSNPFLPAKLFEEVE